MGDAAGGVRSADHAPMARHVGVAAFPVKNRPETGKRSLRSFPTAAGWFFAPALPLGLPRCAGRTGPHAEEHRTRSRVYPRSGASKGASRVNPTCAREDGCWNDLRCAAMRTRVPLCGNACACALLRMRTASRFSPISRCQTAQIFSFPRRMFAPGFCIVASLTPDRGVGGAPRNVRVQRHPWGVS
jgi:hypothetical protein